MNVGDCIRRSNSWHWLAGVVLAAAAASWFVPTYGWRDVMDYRRTRLQSRVKAAEDTLAKRQALSEGDVTGPERETEKAKQQLAEAKRRFAEFAFDELPMGADSVFAALGTINEALAKGRIRLISSGASISPAKESAPAAAAAPKKAEAAKPKEVSVEEFRRQLEAAAASTKDSAVREMILNDGRRKLAQMEAAEKSKAAKPAKPKPDAAAKAPVPAAAAKSYSSSDIAYTATGDFRDIFMFLVAQTHTRPAYSLKDIAVRNTGDSVMDFSFTLQVDHR